MKLLWTVEQGRISGTAWWIGVTSLASSQTTEMMDSWQIQSVWKRKERNRNGGRPPGLQAWCCQLLLLRSERSNGIFDSSQRFEITRVKWSFPLGTDSWRSNAKVKTKFRAGLSKVKFFFVSCQLLFLHRYHLRSFISQLIAVSCL